jgi:MFS family permease
LICLAVFSKCEVNLDQNNFFSKIRQLPRNVWAVSLTSFFNDISSEMVINILPLFLSNVLGVKTNIIGIIEGVAEATASLLKVFSGWLSDKLGGRKWLAVAGYGISTLSKPFFYIANSWEMIAGVRWADRLGKGIRTAPRDALVADSIEPEQRGIAFGFHRAADTGGAVLGILIAALAVWLAQSNNIKLGESTFRIVVLISLIPAVLAVLSLALIARDIPKTSEQSAPKISFKKLGKPFLIFLFIVGIFDLGNSSDAFLVLRAQERGLSVLGILLMLAAFNLVYTLVSTPAGSLSDRIGRRKVIIGGWLVYGAIYLGFALAQKPWHVWALYIAYGIYYGMAYGTAKAMVADLVSTELRGTAYGTYNAVLGIIDFPASLIAGLLWQGVGTWNGFGPSAPFFFGSGLAFLAALLLFVWRPKTYISDSGSNAD